MYYVYILRFKHNGQIYIGSTNNLRRRIRQHAHSKPPFDLPYYEAYAQEKDARCREQALKHFGKAYAMLKRRITDSLA